MSAGTAQHARRSVHMSRKPETNQEESLLPTRTSVLAVRPVASAGVGPFPLEPEASRAWKEENTILYLISPKPGEMEGTETSAESERVTWKILTEEKRHWVVEGAPAIHT